MSEFDRIFYMIPKRHENGEIIDLFLPSDLITQVDESVVPSLGFGIFTFLRSANNRGRPRHLSLPAVIGFGEESRVVNLKLQSDYVTNRIRGADRFSFAGDVVAKEFGIETSFSARKFPQNFRLSGVAARLASHSIWALIPADREYLEMLWAQRAFYLIGHGTLEENNNVSST